MVIRPEISAYSIVSEAHQHRPPPFEFPGKKVPFNAPCNSVFPACKTRTHRPFYWFSFAIDNLKDDAQEKTSANDCLIVRPHWMNSNTLLSKIIGIMKGHRLTNRQCNPHIKCLVGPDTPCTCCVSILYKVWHSLDPVSREPIRHWNGTSQKGFLLPWLPNPRASDVSINQVVFSWSMSCIYQQDVTNTVRWAPRDESFWLLGKEYFPKENLYVCRNGREGLCTALEECNRR